MLQGAAKEGLYCTNAADPVTCDAACMSTTGCSNIAGLMEGLCGPSGFKRKWTHRNRG